jgi:hypothetical protein
MEGWAYGIANYPGEIFPELVFRVLRELEPSFTAAIEHHHIFDLVALAEMFSKAAKYLVHEKDIAFCILSMFPPPSRFDEDGQFVMAQIIDRVEQTWSGALERLEKKWRGELNQRRKSSQPSAAQGKKATTAPTREAPPPGAMKLKTPVAA